MKFTLTSQDENYFQPVNTLTAPATMRTVSFSSDYLHDIVAEFELFLKGSGYVFDRIELFEEDEAEDFEEVASGDLFKDESKDEPQLPDYFGISARMQANNKS
jgi:hypothetical protein